MIVVAGPPGSGKTTYFPVTAFRIDSFNIDDRCAQIVGSYRAISRAVRRAVANASASSTTTSRADGPLPSRPRYVRPPRSSRPPVLERVVS